MTSESARLGRILVTRRPDGSVAEEWQDGYQWEQLVREIAVLQVRPCTAAPPPARALTDPKMCASVLKRVKTGVQRYCASGPSPLPPRVGEAEGGMTKQATKRQRSADAAIARHYALSSLACEFVELLSIGLALCIGRAFNALLFTTS